MFLDGEKGKYAIYTWF